MASRYVFFSYDQLVSLSEAYDKDSPVYCAPDRYGVTAEECESYLKKLIKGERWSERFISSLKFFICLLLFAAILVSWFIFAKHQSILTFIVAMLISAVMISVYLSVFLGLSICPPSLLKRPFYPSTNKNVEHLFDDFLMKNDKLELNSPAEQLDVICQSHPEVEACCKAVREELSHPSGDFIIGDLRFGMSANMLHYTAVYRGIETLKRLKSPSHKTNYLHLFFNVFWSVSNGQIIYDFNDHNQLIGIRITGSDYPTPSIAPWDDDDTEEYPEYDACYDRLNEIYGKGMLVDGKKISLLSVNDFRLTIQISKVESDTVSMPQTKEEQENTPPASNANSKKETKEKPQREDYIGGDPFYHPGAHFDNWMGDTRFD